MKPKKSPEPPFEPFVRPPEIEAIRDKVRSVLPEYKDDDIINNDEPLNQTANNNAAQRTIRIDEEGYRKIVEPDGTEYYYLEDDDDDEDEDSPENNEPAGYEYDQSGAFTIRSGAEWYAQNDDLLPEAQLFGDLWMQNDLCIMFADTNAGKSILAVQIADSISRGLSIPGFGFTVEPAPVLYFDFELSDHQFRSRYSSAETGKYPFTAGFHRATLNACSPKQRRFKTFEEFISHEIENALLCCKAKTLIIDNISCLRYGTHNTAGALNLMQYLQGIKRTYQLSILVLAHTPKRNPTKPLSRNDLQGSKMLINLADSAFAIGESRRQPGLKYLKQIKQRGAPETHGADNVCTGHITRSGSFLHFTFAGSSHESDHLAPQTEQYRRNTEQRIAELHRQRHSVRKIAAQLGLASTTVFRALKKLENCGEAGADEEKQCADVQMCECADEENPVTESVIENQYLIMQQKAAAVEEQEVNNELQIAAHPLSAQRREGRRAKQCRGESTPPCVDDMQNGYTPVTYHQSFSTPNAPALCDSLPTGGCREGFSKPVPPYEAQTYDDPNALPKMCHTEAKTCTEVPRREVRLKPITRYEAQTHDDRNALPQMCHTAAQACNEVPRREVRPKPVIPYKTQTYDGQNANVP